MISISYVIPTYNNLKLLKRCINSIDTQLGDKDRVVIVDDGSEDNTYEYLLKHYGESNNYIILRQNNLGSGAARNLGLKYSKTDYIWFVDSDDYIAKNSSDIIKKFLTKEKYEIIFFNYTKKYLNREGVISLNVNYDDKNDLLLTDHYPWNKIFKRELFKGISFPNENIRYTDHAIIPALLAKAQRVGFLEENLYFYDFSHSNNISKRTDKRDDIYISCDHLYKYYEKGFLSEKEIEIIFIKTFIFDKLFNIDNLKLKDIYYNNLKVEKYLNEKIPNWSSSKCLSYSFTKRYKHNIKNPYIRIFVGNIFKKSNKLSSLLLYVLYFFKCTYKKLLKL